MATRTSPATRDGSPREASPRAPRNASRPAVDDVSAATTAVSGPATAERFAGKPRRRSGHRGGGPNAARRRAIRCQLADRDGPACFYCGHRFGQLADATIDHLIPQCQIPGWKLANLVLACGPCNHAKGDRLPQELLRPAGFGTGLRPVALDGEHDASRATGRTRRLRCRAFRTRDRRPFLTDVAVRLLFLASAAVRVLFLAGVPQARPYEPDPRTEPWMRPAQTPSVRAE